MTLWASGDLAAASSRSTSGGPRTPTLAVVLSASPRGTDERRFSTPWSAPAPRMKEYIQTLRAIWTTFADPKQKADFDRENRETQKKLRELHARWV